MWCRAHQNRPPYNKTVVSKWVKSQFGPLLDDDKRERIARAILDETRRQCRIRGHRAELARIVDPCTTPAGSDARISCLLQSRLGPARRWTKPTQGTRGCDYIDGDVYSGLVAGLIPVTIRLRSITNPNLLVYRYRWGETRTRFVATHITTVADAFIWLIPPEAAEFLQLAGTRVEHDGEAQTVRLITQFGTKILPWRHLGSIHTG